MKRKADNGRQTQTPPQANCGKIRDLLTSFVANELGDAQSSLIREHLRQCADCRKDAQQIMKTFALLRAAGQRPSKAPEKLSDDRRSRVMRAYAQPLLTWLRLNILPITAILIAAAIFLALIHTLVTTWNPQPEFIEKGSITVRLPYNGPDDGPLEAIFTNVDADVPVFVLPIPEQPTSTVDQTAPLVPIPIPPEDEE